MSEGCHHVLCDECTETALRRKVCPACEASVHTCYAHRARKKRGSQQNWMWLCGRGRYVYICNGRPEDAELFECARHRPSWKRSCDCELRWNALVGEYAESCDPADSLDPSRGLLGGAYAPEFVPPEEVVAELEASSAKPAAPRARSRPEPFSVHGCDCLTCEGEQTRPRGGAPCACPRYETTHDPNKDWVVGDTRICDAPGCRTVVDADDLPILSVMDAEAARKKMERSEREQRLEEERQKAAEKRVVGDMNRHTKPETVAQTQDRLRREAAKIEEEAEARRERAKRAREEEEEERQARERERKRKAQGCGSRAITGFFAPAAVPTVQTATPARASSPPSDPTPCDPALPPPSTSSASAPPPAVFFKRKLKRKIPLRPHEGLRVLVRDLSGAPPAAPPASRVAAPSSSHGLRGGGGHSALGSLLRRLNREDEQAERDAMLHRHAIDEEAHNEAGDEAHGRESESSEIDVDGDECDYSDESDDSDDSEDEREARNPMNLFETSCERE